MPKEQYDNLTGLVHPTVESAILRLQQKTYANENAIAKNKLSPGQVVSELIQNTVQFGKSDLVAAIKTALEASPGGGGSSLNVNVLPGVLAQPQKAFIPIVTALPAINDPLSQDGTLISFSGILYRFTASGAGGSWIAQGAVAAFFQDTHANRLAGGAYDPTGLPLGSIFHETDRNAYYEVELVSAVNTWVWQWGLMRGTISPDQKPGDLGTADYNGQQGFQFYSSDFDRTYEWTGAAWVDAEGQPQRDVIQFCRTAPAGNGWHLCDGTAGVVISKPDGTTTTITVPTMNDGTFPRGNAAYSGPNPTAATGPGISGSTAAVSAGTPSGTVSAPIFSGNLDTTGANNGTQVVQSGVGVTVASNGHTHQVVPSGTNSAPTFTGNALAPHSHGVGTLTVDNTGLPRHEDLLPYIRL